MYNVVMFAYNEEDNIASSIQSVFDNVNDDLDTFFIIANGCTDKTVVKALEKKHELGFSRLVVHEIAMGDKCNAWNTYVHELSGSQNVHFFCDADVNFSPNCFPEMNQKLDAAGDETVVIAGMPLSGRNLSFYRELVIERSCFFGNLYGMRLSFIKRMQQADFKLPVGLNWIDSFLTKAVNTDLSFGKTNLPNRTTWLEGVGYFFDSLSVLNKDNVKLYINRIARYELGKLQEVILDSMSYKEWPSTMHAINQIIDTEFDSRAAHLGRTKRWLVRKRLNKMLKRGF